MNLIDELKARSTAQLPPPPERKAIREKAGVSQERMARELGVHYITLLHWESGNREPRPRNKARYAELLAALREINND